MELLNKTSICMSTYNGEEYLQKQVASILSQMELNDELIIVDDASTDGTLKYLNGLNDKRLKIHVNKRNLGHVQSFAKVIGLASGNFILMADQDDIWTNGRLKVFKDALSSGCLLVSANSDFIDAEDRLINPIHNGLLEVDSRNYILNIARIFFGSANYYGCSMGFREELRRTVLPFPRYVESHDLWIAMAGNLIGSNRHIEYCSVHRRIHGGNTSVVTRNLYKKLVSRFIFAISLIHLSARIVSKKFQ